MTVRKHFDWKAQGLRAAGKWVWLPDGAGGEVRMSADYLTIITAAVRVLQDEAPQTVRQVYYALFSAGYIHNSFRDYKRVVEALVQGRQRGMIPWDQIEDRLRMPRHVSMYANLPAFMEVVRNAYRRDVWQDQPDYLEFWLEKDALSGIVGDETSKYGVTLNVGRGYDGWSSLHNAAARFARRKREGKETRILYLGDFDPSGEDMVRSLRDRLAFFGCHPDLEKIAITKDDIEEFDLPQAPGKESDSRSEGFRQEHGELIQVELDALPAKVLRARIRERIEGAMDMKALKRTRKAEVADDERLGGFIDGMEAE